MDKHNLLILLPGYELFGQEKALINVAVALRDVGVTTHFLTHANWGGKLGKYVESLGFRYFPLPLGTLWSIRLARQDHRTLTSNLRSLVKTSYAFWKVARETRATDILVGNATFAAYLIPVLQIYRINLVYRHGDDAASHSFFHRFLNRILFARTNVHVANCEYLRRRLGFNGVKDCMLIRNLASRVADDCHERAVGSGLITSARLNCRLLYVGQLAEHKGITVLFNAFRILASRSPGITLDIAGAVPGVGSCRDNNMEIELVTLRKEFPLQVNYHGFVDDPTCLYSNVDIHILPSVWQDPSPNVVIEAKCAGVPSVAFRVGGVPELINHKEDGYICEEISPMALAGGVEWLWSDKQRLSGIKRAALHDCLERFGQNRFRQQWAKVFRVDSPTLKV